MNLSEREEQMVRRLRKKQASWRWGKWLLLLTGLFLITGAGYCLVLLVNLTKKATLSSAIILAAFSPQAYILAGLGAGLVGYAGFNWNGNPQETLLLKLLDESIRERNSNSKS